MFKQAVLGENRKPMACRRRTILFMKVSDLNVLVGALLQELKSTSKFCC